MSDGHLPDILRRLRAERGWSQTQAAKQAEIAQTVVSRLERGELTNPTTRVLSGLANAYGVPVGMLLDASQGVDVGGAVARGAAGDASGWSAAEDNETPLESALFAVMDPKRYRVVDFDAARRTVLETHRYLNADADLEGLARSILDAASVLRCEGKPANTASIMARVVSGPTIGTAPTREAVNAAAAPEVDRQIRELGAAPGQGAERLKARLAKREQTRKP